MKTLETTGEAVKDVTDWRRIERSLKQRFRREPGARVAIAPTMETLRNILEFTGIQSKGRRSLRNIGVCLVKNRGVLTILSPICLSIPPGKIKKAKVSELVGRHIAFLEKFGASLPRWKLVCLFPPPEREDVEAEAYIRQVCALTEAHYAEDKRIEVALMVDYAPGMIAMEDVVIQEICNCPYLLDLSKRLTVGRSKYYNDLGIRREFWERKTRRTMAQYLILGRIAALNGMLLCNHTSANILCAQYAGGGVLHNPVGFR